MMESAAKQATEQAREQGGRMKAELGGVVVLDFGGQYTQLIARRIREQQVFSAVLPCTSSIEEIRRFEPAGIVLSGGPSSVYDLRRRNATRKCWRWGSPYWGFATACSGSHTRWAAKSRKRRGGSMAART